jgi:hypothetical protein
MLNEAAVVKAVKKTVTKIQHVDEMPETDQIGNINVEEVNPDDINEDDLNTLESG